MKSFRNILALATLAATVSAPASLQMSAYQSGGIGTYTQNFDSLSSVGSANAWVNDSTLTGWFAYQTASTLTVYRATNGEINTGALYSFGANGSGERALGSIGSGTPGNFHYGVQLHNDGASAVSNIQVSFTGEEWRQGGNTNAQNLTGWYQVSPSELAGSSVWATDTNWTSFSSLDFTSPVVGASAAALDGNNATNQAAISATITGLSVPAGSYVAIKWRDLNDTGNDHGLSLDNLTASWTGAGAVDGPPSLSAPATVTSNQGDNVSFTVTANDTVGGDTIALTASNLPAGAVFAPVTNAGTAVGTFVWSNASPASTSTVYFSAADNDGTTWATTVVVIVQLTPKPVVLAPAAVTGNVGSVISFSVTATDVVANGSIALIASNLPAGAVFNPVTNASSVTGTFTWSNASPASTTLVLFVAEDAGGAGSATTAVQVVEIPKPLVTAPAVVRTYPGSNILFTVTATDIVANGTITLSASNLPGGATFPTRASNGTVSSTFTWSNATPVGVYSVYFAASDSGGVTYATSLVKVLTLPVTGEYVVVNEFRNSGATADDAVELVVVADNLDMRGMVLKDYSSSGANDGGGKYEFTTNDLWASVRAGTLIVLRRSHTNSADVTVGGADYNLDVGLDDPAYLTLLGGTFDLGQEDVVQIKAANSVPEGSFGALHTLATAGAAASAQFIAAAGYKLVPTIGNSGGGESVEAKNTYAALTDFNGNDAFGDDTAGSLGTWNNIFGNKTFIETLRGIVNTGQPPSISVAPTNTGTAGQAVEFAVQAVDQPDNDTIVLSAVSLPAGATFPAVTNAGTASGVFTWSNAAPAGYYSVILQAQDNDGITLATTVVRVVAAPSGGKVWINEIHYDNALVDTNEFIEVAGLAGTDLSGWLLVLYNGNNGAVYSTVNLSGTIDDEGCGYGALAFTYPVDGIQNGSPDGIALVSPTSVVQFISYEGTFAAVGGPADGLAATDIGIVEGGVPVGDSIQLTGYGDDYFEFTWTQKKWSPGALNLKAGQFIQGCSGQPPVMDFLQNNLFVWAGTPLNFNVSAFDIIDAEGVTITGSNVPAGASFPLAYANTYVTGAFAWASTGPEGLYDVTFTAVDDNLDGTDQDTVHIRVEGLGTNQILFQGFEPADPWTIAAGAQYGTNVSGGSDYPAFQRIRSGAYSWQRSTSGTNVTTNVLTLADASIAGYTDRVLRLRVSATALYASTNGLDGGDGVRVFVALDGGAFAAADLWLSGNNNSQWGYDAGLEAHADAGAPVGVQAPQSGPSANNYALLSVLIPDSATSIAVRVEAWNDHTNEIWNVDDIEVVGNPRPDIDGDGIPNDYELIYSGSATGMVAGADIDVPAGDGFSNLQEYIAGTDPTNAASYLRISGAALSRMVTVDSVTGRLYRLIATHGLVSPAWTTLVSGVSGTGAPLSLTDPDAAPPVRHYAVGVELAP